MKPFDLEAAKRGEPICNRYSEDCVFITHVPDANPEYRVVALTPSKEVYCFDETGSYYCDVSESKHDLFMATRKRTVWVNVYPPGTNCFGGAYETEAIANNYAGRNRIGNRAWPLEIEN